MASSSTHASSRRFVLRAAGPLLLVALAATAFVLAPPADCQVLYGALSGNVTDQTDAAASGAKVQVVNVATNVSRTALTNERGAFLFSDLQPGVYDLTIEAPSFRTVVQKGVRVDANNQHRIDVRLEVATVSETLEVVASAPTLQTDRADVHEIQTARQVNELPLLGTSGRNYQSLMQIVPGATLDRSQGGGTAEANSAAGSPQRSIAFNVNGMSRLQNNTKLDGASIVYPWLPTNTAYVPSAEAIDEVSIVTNSYNAEQGIAGGAVVNVIVKSGSNSLHGTAWGYNTNSALRAKNYFQTPPTGYKTWADWDAADPDTRPAKNSRDILTQFGANLGGPILKDKLFFFVNWERTTKNNSSPVRTYSLAPGDLRNGDFSGTGVTIYDPASNPDPSKRTPFPDNKIPADRIDPAAKWFVERMPVPTGSGYSNNYTAQGTGSYTRDNIDVKLNFHPTSRMTMFGRYSYSPSDITDPSSLGEVGGDALNGGQVGSAPGRTHIAGLGATYMLTSSLLLDANLGYTKQKLGAENVDIDTNYGLDVLKIPGTNGPDRLQGGIPSFQIGGWANLGNPNTGNPFQFNDKQYVASVSLQWIKGAHAFRVGYDYQNQQLNHFQPQGGTFQTARGTFQFNGNSTMLQGAPAVSDTRYNSWADFLLGLPSGAGKVEQLRNPNSIHMQTHALYVQDQWQLTRDLTVNFGLRWEYFPFPDRGDQGVSRFDPADGMVYTGGFDGVPKDTGASVGAGMFLPRLGIAYRLGEKTVVRAGYGMSSDPKPYIDFRNAYPINYAWSHPAGTFDGKSNPYVPVTTLRDGLDEARYAKRPDLAKGVQPLPTGAGTTTYPKDAERKAIQSWNLTVQREIFSGLSAQLGYVGAYTPGQQAFVNINASAPGTGDEGRPLAKFGIKSDITMIEPYKPAYYNALQAELRGRFNSAQFGIAYTLSKAVNYQDNDANPRVQWRDAAEQTQKGLAGYDRTHNLQVYGVVDLPFGKGRRFAQGGVANALLGGWQVNGIMSLMSGVPITITQNSNGNLNAMGSGQVPDQVKDPEILGGVGKGAPWFDTTAYAPVNVPKDEPQRFGNVERNSLRGPGYFNVDLGVFRTIRLYKDARLQLRVEVLNLLNHPNFANPGGNISDAGTFGIITATTGSGERNLRLGARFSF